MLGQSVVFNPISSSNEFPSEKIKNSIFDLPLVPLVMYTVRPLFKPAAPAPLAMTTVPFRFRYLSYTDSGRSARQICPSAWLTGRLVWMALPGWAVCEVYR
ncbi:unnamed protein product [Protopolystoma xenopodis]|uniref:Uncharacterized protein n=1 Tax=Protopolystoma xenopodis TaxID=117903 RepID=A0A448WXS7_9PLAT|nr:unnamed protein product [Protopolystoma xenopodis]